jgi:hypothetical protein
VWLFVMKGIELPINVLIIIAVAVIVLIAIVAMFYPAFTSGSGTVTLDVAKSQACRALTASSCLVDPSKININNFDANKNGTINPGLGDGSPTCGVTASGDNLWTLCHCYLGTGTDAQGCQDCKTLCGCQNAGC